MHLASGTVDVNVDVNVYVNGNVKARVDVCERERECETRVYK